MTPRSAGRGSRRGLDGPSRPKPHLKTDAVFVSARQGAGATGWAVGRTAGAGERMRALRAHVDGVDALPTCACYRLQLEESPPNPAVQAGFRWNPQPEGRPTDQPGANRNGRHARSERHHANNTGTRDAHKPSSETQARTKRNTGAQNPRPENAKALTRRALATDAPWGIGDCGHWVTGSRGSAQCAVGSCLQWK